MANEIKAKWERPPRDEWPETIEATVAVAQLSVEQRFRVLADEWSRETANVSSLSVMFRHPKYREIIGLGWDVVPPMLRDLQQNYGYWFPALAEITGIRPFDPSDLGNGRRMTDAWVKWGKKKKLI